MANEGWTGLALKVERTRRRVKGKDIADAMGVSPSRIAAIEREQFPSTQAVARYLAALDTWDTSHTPEAA